MKANIFIFKLQIMVPDRRDEKYFQQHIGAILMHNVSADVCSNTTSIYVKKSLFDQYNLYANGNELPSVLVLFCCCSYLLVGFLLE
jgi:hypothetical protein